MRNFVPNLQVRSKWYYTIWIRLEDLLQYKLRINVSMGDIMVLCIDPGSKRSNWQMRIITNTFYGTDNNVRCCT